jgi:hypothetical protein
MQTFEVLALNTTTVDFERREPSDDWKSQKPEHAGRN